MLACPGRGTACRTRPASGEMGIRPEQAGLDAAELALLAIAEAHRMLLTCGLLRDAAPRIASRLRRPVLGGVPARGWPGRIRVRALGAGPGPARVRLAGGPAHGGQASQRQYHEVSAGDDVGPVHRGRDGELGVQDERGDDHPRAEQHAGELQPGVAARAGQRARRHRAGPRSAAAPTAAPASPAIRLAPAALPPPCCSVRNDGDRAIHSPVSTPSAATAWTATPRMVAGSRYSVTAAMVTAA